MSKWVRIRIDQAADVISGGTPLRDNPLFWGAGTPWATPTDITACPTAVLSETFESITGLGLQNSAAKRLPPGTVLLTSRATIGEARIAGMDVCTNQGFKNLVPKPGFDATFLYYQVCLLRSQLERFGVGSTFPEINKRDVSRVEFDCPEGPEEQNQIGRVLRLLDDQIDRAKVLISKQERIRVGLLQDLFTRGVDQNGALRPPREEEPDLYHQTELGWLPKGWEVYRLSSLAESIIDGPFGSNIKTEHYVPEPGVRVVRLQNITAGQYNDADKIFVSEQHADSLARYAVRPRDVLIASLGDDTYEVGRACIYPSGIGLAINKADCFRFTSAPKVAVPEFIALLLNQGRTRREKRKVMQGVTRQRMNLGNCKRLRVAAPLPEEQTAIADADAAVAAELQSLRTKVNHLGHLKSALMQDLLTGRVSVAPLLQAKAA